MTSDHLFASINLLSCRILETGTRSFFVHKLTHTVLQSENSLLGPLYIFSLQIGEVKFANLEEKTCFMCGSHLETLNFCGVDGKSGIRRDIEIDT
jgi:hypothetical protein